MTYALLFAAAVTLGLVLGERLSVDRRGFRILYLSGIAGGFLGGLVWYWAQYGGGILQGGFSIFGFFLAAGGTVVFLDRINRHRHGHSNLAEFSAAAAPILVLGIGIHRLGCFSSGCCFGRPSDLPWTVTFGPGTPAFQHQVSTGLIPSEALSTVPVHPTQLYQSLFAFFLLGALLLLRRWQMRLGSYELLLGTCFVLALWRFGVEFLRDDSGGIHPFGLTFAQATALGVIILIALLVFWGRRSWNQGDARETSE